jgi:hypothetical protein
MNYTAPPPLKVDRVTQSDLNEVSFLLIFPDRVQADMSEFRSVPSCKLSLAVGISTAHNQNDVLGFVDNAHLALSDYKEDGPFDKQCLELSEIHSVSLFLPSRPVLT